MTEQTPSESSTDSITETDETVLVTGGAGFIGSHLTEALLDHGRQVVVLDSLNDYYDVRLKKHNIETCRQQGNDQFTFVEGSITDDDLVEGLFDQFDVDFVYHEAARAGVRSSIEQPQLYEKNNVGGLLTLLEHAVDSDVKRFVNASSSSVYGRPDYLPYDEQHSAYPKSPYATTKLANEHYCKIWNDVHDLPTVSLRYFTVYGPRMRPNMAISNFVSRSLNGVSPAIYGDGEQTRDFTYIDDVVAANLRLLETDEADGEAVNIGSTDNITINELVDHVIAETGAELEPEYEAQKDVDARHTHADISKAQRLLGYESSTDIREGVSSFIDWYQQNRSWYEPLVLSS
jgi:UDP-glucose 4-epimerase